MFRASRHIFALTVFGLLSGSTGFWLMNRFNPQTASRWYFAANYSLIFAFVFSITALGGYLARSIFLKKDLGKRNMMIAERQGVLFGLLAVASLIFTSLSLFNIWTSILLLAVFALIEFYAQ